uniref:Coatomer subunit epsilon n=1 Tax=Trypanosoma congolense (strain IL3000) TaxID=1068625 RepID=G0V2X7_TRYCI|nr:unnamed protein product [Trypanosoma congolense IL3000]
MADPFYDVRNAIAIGNYHQAVAEASGVKTNSRKEVEVAAFHEEKEVLIAMAQVGLGQGEAVIAQLKTATRPVLLAVREWATFCVMLKSRSDNLQEDQLLSSQLKKLTDAAEEVNDANTQIAVLAAAALLSTGDRAGALRLAKRWLNEQKKTQIPNLIRLHLDLHAIAVEALLRMGRPDLARSEVKDMEQLDEESVLTLVCSGITSLYEGVKSRDEYEKALQRFKEVSMLCGQSVFISNLTALAHMQLGDHPTAERVLHDVLAMKSGDPDTAANLAVVSAYLDKASDATSRYTQQAVATSGAWSHSYNKVSSAFDEAVDQFKATL